MILKRFFSTENQSPYDSVSWVTVPVTGFADGVEAPAKWSATAVEIAASKYFRKKSGERSVRQLIHRVARTIRKAGEAQGYLKDVSQAQIFEDETVYILLHQIASFNSPVYFNVGIFSEYGVMGRAENFVVDPKSGKAQAQTNAFVHPRVLFKT